MLKINNAITSYKTEHNWQNSNFMIGKYPKCYNRYIIHNKIEKCFKKRKSNKIKENSNTMRHLNNGTDHRHSKSCCDKRSPAHRTIKKEFWVKFLLRMRKQCSLSIIQTNSTYFCKYRERSPGKICSSSEKHILVCNVSIALTIIFDLFLSSGCIYKPIRLLLTPSHGTGIARVSELYSFRHG